MGESGNEETAELRAVEPRGLAAAGPSSAATRPDTSGLPRHSASSTGTASTAPTQQLPVLIPAMAHIPPDVSPHEPSLPRRWRWPLLALAAAALASVPIALFATSDDSPSRSAQPPALRWPPAAQAVPESPSQSPAPSPSGQPIAPPPPPPEEETAATSPRTAPSPTPALLSYEAEAPGNRLRGRAAAREVTGASGGRVVGWVGGSRDNTLTFTGVMAATAGRHEVTVYYVSQERRTAAVEVNDRFAGFVDFPPTGGWDKIGSVKVILVLRAGANTIEFSNRYAWAPDFDRLVLSGTAAS